MMPNNKQKLISQQHDHHRRIPLSTIQTNNLSPFKSPSASPLLLHTSSNNNKTPLSFTATVAANVTTTATATATVANLDDYNSSYNDDDDYDNVKW
mmetsp:Transcript_4086/g.4708  ORF Transcript_4086/g.4708 Transcript_4086/m.4708 type:complete len:96 (+) Transcript_4086:238-525(+)